MLDTMSEIQKRKLTKNDIKKAFENAIIKTADDVFQDKVDELYMIYLADVKNLTDEEALESYENKKHEDDFIEYIKKMLSYF
jgi:hypothetical protein